MNIGDIVRIKKNNKLGRISKLNGNSSRVKNGIVIKYYVYKETELELVELDKLSWEELKAIINEII
jgi:hypothetical protein